MGVRANTILFIANADWVFLQHRVPFSKALLKKNNQIKVVCKKTGDEELIKNLGIGVIPVDFSRRGVNIVRELLTLFRLFYVIAKEKPDVVFNLTVKPVLYGTLVSRILRFNVVNIICGLGYVFTDQSNKGLRNMTVKFYKFVFKYKKAYTVFENKDDLGLFLNSKIIKRNYSFKVVNGVGVDLEKFKPEYNNPDEQKLIILLPARMLWNKGIKEFIEAAELLREQYINKVYFKLIGKIDKGNPEAISREYLNRVDINGYLKWEGFKSDMVSEYAKANIIVLPSYYGEGLPTVLAEACAMGKPIVTTNSVGCRECVEEGVNGFKVPVKSISALAEAIEKLIISEELRGQFGKASRKLAEKKFDQKQIINQYMGVFDQMLKS